LGGSFADAVEDASRDLLGFAEFADGQGIGLCRIEADDHRAQAWRKCVRHVIERARESRPERPRCHEIVYPQSAETGHTKY